MIFNTALEKKKPVQWKCSFTDLGDLKKNHFHQSNGKMWYFVRSIVFWGENRNHAVSAGRGGAEKTKRKSVRFPDGASKLRADIVSLTLCGPKRPAAQRLQVHPHHVAALDGQPGRGGQHDGVPPVQVVHVEQPLQVGRVRGRVGAVVRRGRHRLRLGRPVHLLYVAAGGRPAGPAARVLGGVRAHRRHVRHRHHHRVRLVIRLVIGADGVPPLHRRLRAVVLRPADGRGRRAAAAAAATTREHHYGQYGGRGRACACIWSLGHLLDGCVPDTRTLLRQTVARTAADDDADRDRPSSSLSPSPRSPRGSAAVVNAVVVVVAVVAATEAVAVVGAVVGAVVPVRRSRGRVGRTTRGVRRRATSAVRLSPGPRAWKWKYRTTGCPARAFALVRSARNARIVHDDFSTGFSLGSCSFFTSGRPVRFVPGATRPKSRRTRMASRFRDGKHAVFLLFFVRSTLHMVGRPALLDATLLSVSRRLVVVYDQGSGLRCVSSTRFPTHEFALGHFFCISSGFRP